MAIKIDCTENDIETYLCENMDKHLGLRFVGRQINTQAGIIDVLAKSKDVKELYYVIELKRGVIDAHAYVQVMRYTHFLNSEKSKDFQRVFMPMLIGNSLCPNLEKAVSYYSCCDLYKQIVSYRLFGFDMDEGISFAYQNSNQSEYEKNLATYTYYEQEYENIYNLYHRYKSEYNAQKNDNITTLKVRAS